MSILRFAVSGIPRPAPRPRADGKGVHKSPDADEWMALVRLAALAELGLQGDVGPAGGSPIFLSTKLRRELPLFLGPVSLGLEFCLPKKGVMHGAAYPHEQVPDLDNLVKAVKDALGNWGHRGAIVWHDDGQVARYHRCGKSWVHPDNAGVWIEVRPARRRSVPVIPPAAPGATGFAGRRLPRTR